MSPAGERRQSLVPRVMGKLMDLKGREFVCDLASSYMALRDGDDGPHLLEPCFNNSGRISI